MTRICGHCHQPIQADEAYKEVIPDSSSNAAPTVYLHKWSCRKAPQELTGAGLGH